MEPKCGEGHSQPPWLYTGKVPCLDGLRAVSIGLVVAEHLARTFDAPLASRLLKGVGSIGVSMFFVISGFLITLLLIRERRSSGTVSIRGFYRRRALRILPAYCTFLLVVFALTWLHAVSLTPADWTAALTYTVNFMEAPSWDIGHIWSLSVEEQFYLVWPLVLLLMPAKAFASALGYLVLAPVVRVILWVYFPEYSAKLDILTPLHLDAIAMGCLLASIAWSPSCRRRLTPAAPVSIAIVAGATLALVVSYRAAFDVTAYDLTFRYSLEALALATIIWSLANCPTTWIGHFLQLRPMVWAGVLSYSLYLWQQPFLNPAHSNWTGGFPQNLMWAIGVALVSYYVVELPFLRIKNSRAAAHFQTIVPSLRSATKQQLLTSDR